MSLRARVLIAFGFVLAVSLAIGVGLAGWQARQSLRDELTAGMLGGRQTVESAFAQSSPGRAPGDLRQLIATFDGNRHVSAALIAPDGRIAVASRPFATAHAAPGWFRALLDPRIGATTIPLPLPTGAYAALRLTSAPEDDVGDAWLQFCNVLAVAAFACASAFGLIYLTIGRALRPLKDLSSGFSRVGAGDYRVRVAESGPSEVAGLARAFNGMAADLAAMQSRNRALEDQLTRLQDEERADLARDLHDEIGPQLFAVNLDASMIGQLAAAGRAEEIAPQVRAIQRGVAHMQKLVRDILGRLRPTPVTELGFEAAVGDLVAFWRGRQPDIAFDLEIELDEAGLSDATLETLYRVVQEGLSNAVRHARPSRVEVFVGPEGVDRLIARVRDDGAGAERAAEKAGFGLPGMRERVQALGGALAVDRGADRGWCVTAALPVERRAAAA
ncbi:MAG TPA: histidine kinase [Caulobacteraceae bacterium]|nr:histidine kinase [Caulobacteraceae bacterium]